MAVNPLQQYFRQPKIYISLPSQGVFNKLGSFQGDATNMPVCGMTGMDEIIMRTPDALLSGESSVKVIESCCSSIKDAWEVSTIDVSVIFAAIRIATFGNTMTFRQTCPKCSTENEYDVDLSRIIEHFRTVKYNNKLQAGNLLINTKPLTYKQSTDYNLKNFQLQQKLSQAQKLEDPKQQQETVNRIFLELAELRNQIYKDCIESVQADGVIVDDVNHITEFLANCDKTIFDQLSDHVEKNKKAAETPDIDVECESCKSKNKLYIELDQSNFFV